MSVGGKESKCYSRIDFVENRKLNWVEVRMMRFGVDRRRERKLIEVAVLRCLTNLTVIDTAGREIWVEEESSLMSMADEGEKS